MTRLFTWLACFKEFKNIANNKKTLRKNRFFCFQFRRLKQTRNWQEVVLKCLFNLIENKICTFSQIIRSYRFKIWQCWFNNKIKICPNELLTISNRFCNTSHNVKKFILKTKYLVKVGTELLFIHINNDPVIKFI